MPGPSTRPAFLRLDGRVYLLGSAGLIRSVGRSATFVFLPLVFADVYRLPYLEIGLLIAAIVPVSTLAFLLGGYLSDRQGRRALAIYPNFLSAVVLVLLWLYLDRGIPVVMGLWAVNSLLGGLTRPARSAMVGDVTSPDLAVTAFGVQRVFSNTGFAISPALGGLLATSSGLPALFLFAAVTSAIEGVILVTLLRETFAGTARTGATATNLSTPFRDRPFVGLLVGLVGLALVMNQFGTPLALFLGSVRAVPLTEFGLVYSLNGVLVVLLQLPVSRVIERRHRYIGWLAGGTLAYGASFLLFDLSGALPMYLLSMGVLTLGEDIVSPTEQSLVAHFAGRARRGSYFGAYNAATNATRVLAPVAGTLLLGIGPQGPELLWGGMAVVALAVALGFVNLRDSARRRLERSTELGAEPPPSDLLLSDRE